MKRFFIFLVIFSLAVSISFYAYGQKKVKAVNWRNLSKFLPNIKGWKADGKAEGQTMTFGNITTSQAERNYTSGKKSLHIVIVDSAFAPMVLAGYKSMAAFEMDTSEEFIKKITIKGFPAVEHYNYDDKEAELYIAISDRFLLTLQGENFKSTAGLKKIANGLPLKKIAALAK